MSAGDVCCGSCRGLAVATACYMDRWTANLTDAFLGCRANSRSGVPAVLGRATNRCRPVAWRVLFFSQKLIGLKQGQCYRV